MLFSHHQTSLLANIHILLVKSKLFQGLRKRLQICSGVEYSTATKNDTYKLSLFHIFAGCIIGISIKLLCRKVGVYPSLH